MSEFSALINAIIMLPVGAAIDGLYARQCIRHVEKHGYRLAGILLHDWSSALTMLRSEEAEVIVMARAEHFDPDWTPRVEFVGPDTRDLSRYAKPRNEGTGDSRSRRPRITR